MTHRSDLIASDIDAYLKQHEEKELLRFLTCGSVDDGKSTLIGRLLYDSKMIYEDQLAALRKDSLTHGTTGDDFDPALLTDGLKAEREQGITIDVANRYFSTAKRKFIIADTPGHEQYTRNMATGASTCDLAVILIDARHGVLTQTRRHTFIVSLLGIRHVVVAVNKMDLVDFSEEVYDKIRDDYRDFTTRLEMPDLHFIPLSALKGDNVVDQSEQMPWYHGPTLMHFLETVYIGSDRNLEDFRFSVQLVNRPHLDFRGYCGTIASGIIRKGETVMALPSRKTTQIASIVTFDGDVDEAFAPQSITLTLEDEIDISRGDVIVRPGNLPQMAASIEAVIVWMHEQPMVPGKPYWFKHGATTVPGEIRQLRYRVDVNTLHRTPAPNLQLNEIGRCAINLNHPVAFDDYRRNRITGGFIMIDRMTNATVAAGMIMNRRTADQPEGHWDEVETQSLHGTASPVAAEEREARFGQKPATLLLTGLTGSGKTTIAYALERRLFDEGHACVVLDGQNLRRGVSRDLGFTPEDRSENLRRAAEIACFVNDAGLICIAAFLAPSEDIRQKAGRVVGEDRFLTIHLDASEHVRRERDEHGLYDRADQGELSNFPGVSAPYDIPTQAELMLDTDESTVKESVEKIIAMLQSRGHLLQ